jgi:hypothetical protein
MTMFKWTCEQLARQLIKQHGERIQRRLKWLVALRLYENEWIFRVETFRVTLAKLTQILRELGIRFHRPKQRTADRNPPKLDKLPRRTKSANCIRSSRRMARSYQ